MEPAAEVTTEIAMEVITETTAAATETAAMEALATEMAATITVSAAIKELEKIEMVRQLDNIYRLDHAVTANQKVILKAFGLDANSIKYFASELSKELKEAE